jgi:hypothetical protein
MQMKCQVGAAQPQRVVEMLWKSGNDKPVENQREISAKLPQNERGKMTVN